MMGKKKKTQPAPQKVENMRLDEVLELFRTGALRLRELDDQLRKETEQSDRRWSECVSDLRRTNDELWQTGASRNAWRTFAIGALLLSGALAAALMVVVATR